jgi:hypothetical protein
MQKLINGDVRAALANPILDFWITGAEAQLKAWQAYQVEGTRFVAKRLQANLEFLRSLGHCGEWQDMAHCHRAWLADLSKDYTDEIGRLGGTTAALTLTTLGPATWTSQARGATVRATNGSARP